MSHYFDDLPVGFVFQTEAETLTREDILNFARTWDPQPFHTDEEAARDSHFGSLIASGWHTILVGFNLALKAGIWNEASMGASGVDEVRWYRPVLPGDRVYVRGEVIAAERSHSRPDRGRVRILYDIHREDGEKVASYIGNHLIKTGGTMLA